MFLQRTLFNQNKVFSHHTLGHRPSYIGPNAQSQVLHPNIFHDTACTDVAYSSLTIWSQTCHMCMQPYHYLAPDWETRSYPFLIYENFSVPHVSISNIAMITYATLPTHTTSWPLTLTCGLNINYNIIKHSNVILTPIITSCLPILTCGRNNNWHILKRFDLLLLPQTTFRHHHQTPPQTSDHNTTLAA